VLYVKGKTRDEAETRKNVSQCIGWQGVAQLGNAGTSRNVRLCYNTLAHGDDYCSVISAIASPADRLHGPLGLVVVCWPVPCSVPEHAVRNSNLALRPAAPLAAERLSSALCAASMYKHAFSNFILSFQSDAQASSPYSTVMTIFWHEPQRVGDHHEASTYLWTQGEICPLTANSQIKPSAKRSVMILMTMASTGKYGQ
jgi:hypothetical protein